MAINVKHSCKYAFNMNHPRPVFITYIISFTLANQADSDSDI